MQLTPSQEQGLLQFQAFMLDPAKKIASVSGPAGVGKSVFTDHCLGKVESLNNLGAYIGKTPITQRLLTATTNKAAKVLKEMPNADPDAVGTIYSVLGLQVRRNFNTGRDFLAKGKNYGANRYRNILMVVDEASYSSGKLVKYLRESTHDCKIVLVGDHCQLTSVDDPGYNIFEQSFIDTKIHLLDPIRFDPLSPLGQLNAKLRNWVMNQESTVEIVPNGVDIVFAHNSDIQYHLEQAFIHGAYGDTRVIGYQNMTCVNYNNHIRSMLGFAPEPSVGEHMVVASAYTPQGSKKNLYVDAELEIVDAQYNCIDFDGIRGHRLTTNKGVYQVPTDFALYNSHLKMLAREYRWQEFYALKDAFVDMRPDYARTAFKAQGSTHDTVIIDLCDLMQMQSRDQFIRALYVAVSRARLRVIIYGYPV